MAVFIRGQRVDNSSLADNGGVFLGQTVGNCWDSFVVEKGAAGYSMGDGSLMTALFAGYFGRSILAHPMQDGDWKDNDVRSTMT